MVRRFTVPYPGCPVSGIAQRSGTRQRLRGTIIVLMLFREDPSLSFLRLLVCAIDHRLIRVRDLQQLANASHELNPMSLASGEGASENRFALTEAFEALLRPGMALDWPRIAAEAQNLAAELVRHDENANRNRYDTRWMELGEKYGSFNYVRWADCWSRRDLESVLEFFGEDARYTDSVRGYEARGKAQLRSLFARLFHAFDGKMAITQARFDWEEAEYELEWVQTGSRIPGFAKDPGGGQLDGKCNLRLKTGKIATCVDSPNLGSLKPIALQSPVSNEPALTAGMNEAVVTSREVVLMKPVKFKRSGEAKRREDR